MAKVKVKVKQAPEGKVRMYYTYPYCVEPNGSAPDVFGMKASVHAPGVLAVEVPEEQVETELGRDHCRLLTEEEYALINPPEADDEVDES
jgi:hypothetical protein